MDNNEELEKNKTNINDKNKESDENKTDEDDDTSTATAGSNLSDLDDTNFSKDDLERESDIDDFDLSDFGVGNDSKETIEIEETLKVLNDILSEINTDTIKDEDAIDSIEAIDGKTMLKDIGGTGLKNLKAAKRPFVDTKNAISDINKARQEGRISTGEAIVKGVGVTLTAAVEATLVSIPSAVGTGLDAAGDYFFNSWNKSLKEGNFFHAFWKTLIFLPLWIGSRVSAKITKFIASSCAVALNKLKRTLSSAEAKTRNQYKKEITNLMKRLKEKLEEKEKLHNNRERIQRDLANFLISKNIKFKNLSYDDLKKIDTKNFTPREKKRYDKMLNDLSNTILNEVVVLKEVRDMKKEVYKINDRINRLMLNKDGNESLYKEKSKQLDNKMNSIKTNSNERIDALKEEEKKQHKMMEERNKYIEKKKKEGENNKEELNEEEQKQTREKQSQDKKEEYQDKDQEQNKEESKEEQSKEKDEQDKDDKQPIKTGSKGKNLFSFSEITTDINNIHVQDVKQRRDNNSRTGPSII